MQPLKVASLGLVAAAGVGSYVYLKQTGLSVDTLVQELQDTLASQSGPQGPAIFIAAYALATVLLFPASLLTLAAGYLYGPLQGTAVVSAASTLGATLSFLVSRYAARPLVEGKLAEYPRFQAIDQGISKQGAKLVLLLRLSPLFPFNLLNYGLGVTDVKLWEYVAASWAGMLPGTFAYVYLGSVGKEAVSAAGGSGLDSTAKFALYAVGAVATLWATKLVAGAASSALDQEVEGQGEQGEQQQQLLQDDEQN